MRSDLDLPVRLVVLPALVLMLAIPIALGSLPPFRFGYWDKAEPMVVWLHLCGGLGSLALAGCAWKHPRLTVPYLTHPYVIAPLAVTLWSVLAAPFAPLSLLSLMGVPQSGLGALWFLDIAVLLACALIVRDCRLAWKLVCWEAAVVTLAVAAIKLVDHNKYDLANTLLLYVEAYYGWLGVTLPVLVCPWPWARKDWPLVATILVASLFSVYTSHSLTARALLGGGAAFVLAARFIPLTQITKLTSSRYATTGLVAVVALIPPVILRILDGIVGSDSLRDRIHLQDMMVAAMTQSPSWVFGHGWGRVQDAFHANLNVTGESLWQPTWIFLSSDYFSSHNWLLDAAHAIGLPGAILQLAGFVVLPLYASPKARPVATALAMAYALIGAVWFQLSFSLPFFVLGMAVVAQPAGKGIALPKRLPWLALVLLASIQIGVASVLTDFGLAIGTVRRENAMGAPTLHPWPTDPRGSDLEATEVLRDAFGDLAKAGRPRPEMVPAARAMFATLAARIPETGTVQTITTGLGVMSTIHFSRELAWLEPELPGSQDLWRSWLDRLLALAPGRTDQAIPYLTYRATLGDLTSVADIVASILRHNPNDPVGLYFRGLVQVLNPDPSTKRLGIASLKASAAAGIERFMPLDPVVRQLIAQK